MNIDYYTNLTDTETETETESEPESEDEFIEYKLIEQAQNKFINGRSMKQARTKYINLLYDRINAITDNDDKEIEEINKKIRKNKFFNSHIND